MPPPPEALTKTRPIPVGPGGQPYSSLLSVHGSGIERTRRGASRDKRRSSEGEGLLQAGLQLVFRQAAGKHCRARCIFWMARNRNTPHPHLRPVSGQLSCCYSVILKEEADVPRDFAVRHQQFWGGGTHTLMWICKGRCLWAMGHVYQLSQNQEESHPGIPGPLLEGYPLPSTC